MNSIYNNPNLVDKFLEQTHGKLHDACKTIPGVGKAVLSLRQYQQGIFGLLDSSNAESHAKVIYFKEFVNKKTKQIIYKVVFFIKTFTNSLFLGIESVYKPNGFPSFEVLSYIADSNLDNVKKVMKDQNIKESEFLACGDIKDIFSLKVHRQTETKRVGGNDNS